MYCPDCGKDMYSQKHHNIYNCENCGGVFISGKRNADKKSWVCWRLSIEDIEYVAKNSNDMKDEDIKKLDFEAIARHFKKTIEYDFGGWWLDWLYDGIKEYREE